MSKTLPSNWERKPLISLADYINGYSFNPNDWSKEGRLIIRIEQLNNPKASGDRFNGEIPAIYNIEYGDLLFSWSATLKAKFWNGESGVLNQHLFKVIAKHKVDINLIQKLLEFYMDKLAAGSQGSAMKHITRKDLNKFQVALPLAIKEQQKIAKILSTVDKVIEQTQALIDKYTAIKQGMMADLFTCGIDLSGTPETNPNHGQLRPSFEEEPKLYKETELGWLPKDWELKRCEEVNQRICVGIVIQPSKYYVEEGVPAFRSANIRENEIDPRAMVYISKESNELLVKSQVKTGDVLSVRTGYPGTSAVVTEEFNGVNCIDILISTPTPLISSNFLCEWINSEFGKGQILKAQGGAAQQHFNVGDMQELKVVLPSIQEQLKIIEVSGSIDKKIRNEKQNLSKKQSYKKGLMQDLLTGKVRVNA